MTLALHPHRDTFLRDAAPWAAILEEVFADTVGIHPRSGHAIEETALALAAMIEKALTHHSPIVIARRAGELAGEGERPFAGVFAFAVYQRENLILDTTG